MTVYGIILEDPTFVSRDDYLTFTPSFFESVIKRSIRYGFNFKGYIVDVEPHTLPDWNEKQELYLKRLIELSAKLRAIANSYGASLSMCVPYWYHDVIKLFDNRGLDAFSSDFLTLMTYMDNRTKILTRTDRLMATLITPTVVAVNIDPSSPDPHMSYSDFKILAEEFQTLQSKYPQLIGLSIYKSTVI
jgi:hypothetical protein